MDRKTGLRQMSGRLTKAFEKCPSEELLADYVDESLPDWEAGTLLEHLAMCDSCAERVRELFRFRRMWSIIRDSTEQIFRGVEPTTQPLPSLAGILRELGGKVWSIARVAYRLPERIPELIPAPSFADSPFAAFAMPAANLVLAHVRTRSSSKSTIGHSVERSGKHEIRIVFDDTTRETVVVLDRWEGGPPPHLVVQRISPTKTGQRAKIFHVEWKQSRKGGLQAVLPVAADTQTEVLIAIGPARPKQRR